MFDLKFQPGSRIAVRQFRPDDAPAYFGYAKQEAVTRLAGMPALVSRDEATARIAHFIVQQEDWAVTLDDHLIGNIGLYPRLLSPDQEDDLSREIGYMLDPAFSGRGFMSEAVELMVQAAFKAGSRQIWAGVFPENVASIRLLRRTHFQYQFTVPLPQGLTFSVGNKEQYYLRTPSLSELPPD